MRPRLLRFAAIVAALAVLSVTGVARAADPPAIQTPLQSAQHLYDEAKFAEAVSELTEALRTGRVTGDDANAARELLARSLVRAGRRLEAKEAFKGLLRSDPAYRADGLRIPPDEMDIYQLAKREFDAEEAEAHRRIPASIGLFLGQGSAVNQDFVDLAEVQGGSPEFDAKKEFGGSVRFPLRPRFSIDLEISRLRATAQDNLDPSLLDHTIFTVSGIPLVASLSYAAWSRDKLRVNLFGGVGALMVTEAQLEFTHLHTSTRIIPVQITSQKTGTYAHAGLEAEYLLVPRFAINGRVNVRQAGSGELDWKNPDFELYEGFPTSKLGGRAVDFSGVSAALGIRAYIGY